MNRKHFWLFQLSLALTLTTVTVNATATSNATVTATKERSAPVDNSTDQEELLNILGAEPDDALFQEQHEWTISLRKELGNLTAEQNIFLSFLDKNQYEKAIYQWWPAFETSDFRKTSSGRALYAFLLFKNQLEVNGLQNLMDIEKPNEIHSDLIKLWKLLVPAGSPVWNLVKVNWNDDWTSVFDVATEIQVRSRQMHDLADTGKIFELLRKTGVGSRERSWLEWQMALGLSLVGDVAKAAKVLSHLMKDKSQLISEDLQNVTAARLLYQQGYLGPAIGYYTKIPMQSEYWYTAQEEMAWSYIRKGEPQNTLAVTQTLMHKDFAPQVGPEAIFLRALAFLKVCDYPEVVNTINEFRKRFKDRAQIMMSLRESGQSPDIEKLMTELRKGRVRLLSLGPSAGRIPSYVSRDEVLFDLVQAQKALEKESQLAGDLYSRSLTGGSDQVGFQARLEDLKKLAEQKLQSAKSATYARIKDLASEEVSEIQRILQKMQIVDAEVIQQIERADRIIKANLNMKDQDKNRSEDLAKLGSTGSRAKHAVKYPFEGETWFDELTNYKVNIKKGCLASRGGSR
jgi:hypothetical protein